MSSNNTTSIGTKLKKGRFEIQKNIHVFMREMLRYYDVYLLSGTLTIKAITFQLLTFFTTLPNWVIGIFYFLEFFFLFTRVAMEYHRKKKQESLYIEMSNIRFKYIIIVYGTIIGGCMWSNPNWDGAGAALICGILYYLSNNLLISASLTIHTKDVEFTEKIQNYKKVVVLNEKAKPKIIAEKGTENKKQEAEITVEEEKPETTAMRKKLQNFLYRIKTAKATGDEKTASKRTNDMMKFMEEIEMDFPEMTLIYEQKLQELD